MTGPMVYGGGGRATTAQPSFSMVDAAVAAGLGASAVDRTSGWSLMPGATMAFRGIRARMLYSGAGTDSWDLSLWKNGTRVARVAKSITADGTHSIDFGAPVSVAAFDDVVVGMRCTSASRVLQAAASSGNMAKFFGTSATQRIKAPHWNGSFFITRFSLYANGDAVPATETFDSYASLIPVEPYT